MSPLCPLQLPSSPGTSGPLRRPRGGWRKCPRWQRRSSSSSSSRRPLCPLCPQACSLPLPPVGPFDATPAQVAVFLRPFIQPPFVPAYPGLGYHPPMPRVPVVGITPSQMVANAFCSAAPAPAPTRHPAQKSWGLPTPCCPQRSGGQARPRPNGAPWPPEPAPAPAPELDPFEAQWAALEGKPAVEKPSNPFSGDLQRRPSRLNCSPSRPAHLIISGCPTPGSGGPTSPLVLHPPWPL